LDKLQAGNLDHLTIQFDHWKDPGKRGILGIILTTRTGDRYLADLKDCSTDGHYNQVIVDGLVETLLRVPKKSINAIISDSASTCERARKDLIKLPDFQHVIQHRCIAHLLNRLGNDFTKNQLMQGAIEWASSIVSFISNNSLLLARLKASDRRRREKPCPVRWYSYINMIETLIGSKELLIEEINAMNDTRRIVQINDQGKWRTLENIAKIIRPLANCIGLAERKQGALGDAVKCLFDFGKSLFESGWDDPFIVAAIESYVNYLNPSKLGTEEFSLMLSAYALTRKYKMDYLTEDAFDLVLSCVAKIANLNGESTGFI